MIFRLAKKITLIAHKKIVLMVLILLTLSVSASATYFFKKNLSALGDPGNQQFAPEVLGGSNEAIFELPAEPPKNLGTLNVLLLGYGGAGHQGGFLTDVIQVVHFDFKAGKIVFISIPRDLWVTLPNNTADKINAAYALDQETASSAKTMAQIVTNLKIDYYIAMDFVGFQRTIGYELKGLEVNVPETLQDDWYPIEGEQLNPCGLTPQAVAETTAKYSGFELEKQFPCRYEKLYFPAGINKMEGGDALKYVRSRHSTSDFARSERQAAVLKAIKNKLFSLDVFATLPKSFAAIGKHAHTDINLEIAKYLAPAIKNSQNYTITNVTLSTENVFKNARSNTGQFILTPKQGANHWNQVHEFISKNL